MPRLNVQAELRRLLAKALPGTEVRVTVPDPRPERLVVVRREGGARQDALLDAPGVGLDVYGGSEDETAELADEVSDAMRALPFLAGFAHLREEAVRSDRDVKRDCPRWYLSYTIKTFKPKK